MKAADKRRYERLKAEKRCVRCGAQDERTKAGRTLCKSCYEYDSKNSRLRYRARREAQRCVVCGGQDNNTRKGRAYCFNCAVYNADATRKSYQKKKTAQSGNSETV
jgi:hypothetical protein